jgi:hypothetical protein
LGHDVHSFVVSFVGRPALAAPRCPGNGAFVGGRQTMRWTWHGGRHRICAAGAGCRASLAARQENYGHAELIGGQCGCAPMSFVGSDRSAPGRPRGRNGSLAGPGEDDIVLGGRQSLASSGQWRADTVVDSSPHPIMCEPAMVGPNTYRSSRRRQSYCLW